MTSTTSGRCALLLQEEGHKEPNRPRDKLPLRTGLQGGPARDVSGIVHPTSPLRTHTTEDAYFQVFQAEKGSFH